jgi:RimJ/RimL family protein N-acetyltransferase
LHRVGASVPGYNAGALRFFTRFGFVEEVRRREALLLHDQRYDDVWFGLLRSEWSKQHEQPT